MSFYVIGGVYTDLSFAALDTETAEHYGPFDTYEKAYTKWLETARFKVDNACHRLTIVEQTKILCK